MYDTIIIGAGMSGLAAGIRLAYFDQRVCILERHYTIGGLNSFYRLRGRDYDVGLHAITNFAPPGVPRGPLSRIMRQLRFKLEDFALAPQRGSAIAFPDVTLHFGNGIELLEAEVAQKFPRQIDRFRYLVAQLLDYDEIESEAYGLSARRVLAERLSDPLLIEMLLCPLMWYSNARERDMDYGHFCLIFRALFLEGMARPLKGVRLILKNLVRRFRSLGGELKLRSGVSRIRVEGRRAVAVLLDNGGELVGRRILSSAGRMETLRMCDDITAVDQGQTGQITCAETVSVLDCQPAQLGHDATIVFFNDSHQFHWHKPQQLCDLRTGVICSPNNYQYENGAQLQDGFIRVTSLANYDRWAELDDRQYQLEKLKWYDCITAKAVQYIPDYRWRVIDTDMFTPRTIHRFTWHANGAVYGAPEKKLDGRTHLDNLFLCGADQGYVGVVGAILSGIAVANRHCLKEA